MSISSLQSSSASLEKRRPALLATICAASMMLVAEGAMAQDVDSDLSVRTPLDEIIVTARRRAESLQDIPVAVSVFNADRISELQADDISGIQYSTPNLYFDQGDASNAVVYLRGIGQNDSLAFADPGVGVYVDDVFIARSQGAFLELFDVERVEVLRGPQGTLYGRNTIGGAVKFVSSPPPDEFSAYLEAGAGNYDFRTLKGSIGGPLVKDQLRAKVAFSSTQRDGFNTNSVTGDDDGDVKSLSGRASLLFTPTQDWEFLVSVDAKRDRPDTSRSPSRLTPITITSNTDPSGLVTLPASTDEYAVDTNANGLSDLSAWGLSFTSRWQASDSVSLESITSYREMDFDLNLDTDGSPAPVLDILLLQEQNQFSQEFRGTFDDGGPFTVTGGLYYFHDEDVSFSGVDNGAATIFGFPVTLFGFASSSLAETNQVTDSYAAFADATYAVSDRLDVSAGLRYTYEEKTSQRVFENFFDPTVSVINATPPFLSGQGVPGVQINGEEDFNALTPKVSVSYKATDDALIYASASRGFKSGGFDGRANNDFSFQPFDPEFVWSYEAGLKTSWLDGALIANTAFFYNDYTDLQVTSFGADPVTGVFVSQFTNAAAAKIKGFELEILAQPTDGLTLSGTLGWLDAEYDEFNILVGGVSTDVSDRPLVNAPKWNGSVSATYEHPISASMKAVFHADAGYRAKRAIEISASPELTQDGHEMVNAFAAIKTNDARWEFRAGVKNATDATIRVQGFNLSEFPGVQTGFYAAPRTYDFRVIYKY